MRVGFLIPSFPVASQTFVKRKVEYLLQQGHCVELFCRWHDKSIPSVNHANFTLNVLYTPKGLLFACTSAFLFYLRFCFFRPKATIKFLRKCIPRSNARRRQLVSLLNVPRVWRKKLDIIHFHFAWSIDEYRCIKQFVDAPILLHVYGSDINWEPGDTAYSRAIYHENLANIDHIVACSLSIRKSLVEIGWDPGRMTMIYNEIYCDHYLRRVRTKLRDPIRLLTVARLHRNKSLSTAIAALAILKKNGIRFHYRIVGEGPLRLQIENQIQSAGLDNDVILLGRKTELEVVNELDHADIFLLPSIEEEFGVVSLEAQASGLPIIASRVGGIPETLIDGETGLLVEPADPNTLAQRIRDLINDLGLIEKLSKNGPIHAQKFDASTQTARCVELYRRLIRSNTSNQNSATKSE